MKLGYIINDYYRYATTNPPINETKCLKLYYPEAEPVLEEFSLINGYKSTKRYRVDKAKETELLSLLEELNAPSLIEKRLSEKETPQNIFDVQCGGAIKRTLTICIDGREAVFEKFTDEIIAVVKKMNEILSVCGEPYFSEDSDFSFAPDCVGIGMPVSPPIAATANVPAAEGEWKCPACKNNNTGKFCTECATPKP